MSLPLIIELSGEQLDAIAARVAERLADGRAPDEDRWLRGAEEIASHIGAPRSRVYALANCHPPRIPIERDGSNYVARKAVLDRWVAEGGGKRP